MDSPQAPAPPSTAPKPPESGVPATGRRLNLIRRDSLDVVVDSTLDKVLVPRLRNYDEAWFRRLRNEFVRTFMEGLRGAAKPIRGTQKTEFLRRLEKSGSQLVRQSQEAKLELEALTRRAASVRETLTKDLDVFDSATREFETKQDQELDRELRDLIDRGLKQGLSAKALGDRVSALAIKKSRVARVETRDQWAAEHNLRVDQLERRIAKLKKSVQDGEAEMRRLARAGASVDGGVASIYRDVQGLDASESAAQEKQGMLTVIFESNYALQKHATTDNELIVAVGKVDGADESQASAATANELDFKTEEFEPTLETSGDAGRSKGSDEPVVELTPTKSKGRRRQRRRRR